MTLTEAYQLALKVLKQVMEEKVDESNVQLAQVRVMRGRMQPATDGNIVNQVIPDGKAVKFEIFSEIQLKEIIAGMP